MRSNWRQVMALASLLGLAPWFGPIACQRATTCPQTLELNESDAAPPVDPALLAFLSRARSAHHLADLSEQDDPVGATRILMSVMDGPIPVQAGTHPPEAREVLADTAARIADLQSRQLEFEAAIRGLQSALRLVPEVNYFRGHLFETQGLVEQRRSEHLAQIGQSREAANARNRALSAFETSMQIQSEVIRQAASANSEAPSTTPPMNSNAHDARPVNSEAGQGSK